MTGVLMVITIGPMQNTPAREALAEYMSSEKGRTQVWLAKTLGVSQSTVSLWVRGNSRPPLWYALALQFLTGIPVDMWLTEEERRVVASVSVEAHRVMEERAAENGRRRFRSAGLIAPADPRQVSFEFKPVQAEDGPIDSVVDVPPDAAMTLLAAVSAAVPDSEEVAP